MRARMALLQANRAFQAVDIRLRDKPAAMVALSSKGTVPVLQLPDGQVVDESWEIMAWAWAPADHEGWWTRAQSPENRELLRCNDGDFKTLLDRYKYPQRFPDASMPTEAARSLAVAAHLVPLETRLRRDAYLGGSVACATDLAIFPFVRQFGAVEPAWFAAQKLPATQAWLAAWLRSRLFEVCMTKLPRQTAVDFPCLPTEST